MSSWAGARGLALNESGRKSLRAAYVLWFVLGHVGAHRFYLDRKATALAMPVLFVLSAAATTVTRIGGLGLVTLLLWALIDAALIPSWVREHNDGFH
ncbi:TM2 domain-containing protein [Rhodovastum sp. RN2-1]|uniref:TM2 domain-containing protein n=1 Tax=Limobrevibacterium gyesilva TaxID=2991712 RepID=A0AA41YLY4_9PROT|nr:TM2 domain-containing protein [Limobrevibacterium gyesilva]